MDQKVTIVIPTFNRAHYVTKTIDSALAQTYPCSIIVCDHGSKDNTPEVMKTYGDKIKYIRRERDFGPHFCWLEGILHADTEYVHLHYDDDLMRPTFIEKTLPLMKDDVGVVFTEASVLDLKGTLFADKDIYKLKHRFKTGVYDNSLLEKMLLEGCMISPAACLYRKKDVVDAIYPGDLPVNFGGNYHGAGPDHFMTLQTLLRYKNFGVVVESLCILGSHDGSITMDACKDREKKIRLEKGYEAVRSYYRLLRIFQKNKRLHNNVKGIIKCERFHKRLERRIKIILKAIGLRKKEVK
ncbi:MAG: hypothetical protein A2007_02835 [Verrucomicrobia bacterium GWC2_42_7]|nr:MAG: hypothetical protein A2007_02835 [Verrucomicrobia bacterium GWC2_42_7]